jgi:hypothetical protein
MTGDQISFIAGGRQYTGRVTGDVMNLAGMDARRLGS